MSAAEGRCNKRSALRSPLQHAAMADAACCVVQCTALLHFAQNHVVRLGAQPTALHSCFPVIGNRFLSPWPMQPACQLSGLCNACRLLPLSLLLRKSAAKKQNRENQEEAQEGKALHRKTSQKPIGQECPQTLGGGRRSIIPFPQASTPEAQAACIIPCRKPQESSGQRASSPAESTKEAADRMIGLEEPFWLVLGSQWHISSN